jgi:glycosyltransferase involved in cell wall biosynthesis
MTFLSPDKDKRPRVGMVVHAYYLRDARVRRYAEALVDAGYEVDVFCLRDQGEPPRQCQDGVAIVRIPITRMRGGKLSYCLEYLSSFLLFTAYVTFFQFRRQYHLVHIHTSPDALVFTAWLPKLMGARIMLDFHDPMPELYMSKFRLTSDDWTIRLLRRLERLSASFADVLVTANPTFQSVLVSRGLPSERLHVINNFADPKIFQARERNLRKDPSSFVLLYVGTIAERYGLDVVIRALPALRGAIPRVQFKVFGKITGEGKDQDRLKELARSLGVLDVVQFHSPVSVDRVADEMAESDVGIHTPVKDVIMDYCFPLKVGEFVAMRMPIVATRTPILEEYLGDDGAAYIRPGDVSGFTEQVLKLHGNPEYRDAVLRGAEKFLSRYNWATERGKYLDLVARQINFPS